jgi:hypothetical protein
MAKSIRDIKKKIGRPKTTGSGAAQLVRMHDAQLTAIDTWRQKHDVGSRPEAIRRLVELGLKALPSKKGRSDQTMKDSDGRIIPSLPASGLKAKK